VQIGALLKLSIEIAPICLYRGFVCAPVMRGIKWLKISTLTFVVMIRLISLEEIGPTMLAVMLVIAGIISHMVIIKCSNLMLMAYS
jgi:hypothetical protein